MQALEDLDYLAALDDDGNLSEVGIIMSELPLEPPLAKALIAACEYDCVDELLTIAAMLTGKKRKNILQLSLVEMHTAAHTHAHSNKPHTSQEYFWEQSGIWLGYLSVSFINE